MSMMRWSPIFPEMRDMNRVIERLMEEGVRPGRFIPDFGEAFVPSIDMYETPKEVVVKASVPGIKAEDLDVHITDNTLTIRGERKVEEEVKKENYFYQEHRYGAFGRTLSLPVGVNADKAEAEITDGVLMLRIPKAAGARPKQLKVKAKASPAKRVVSSKAKASK